MKALILWIIFISISYSQTLTEEQTRLVLELQDSQYPEIETTILMDRYLDKTSSWKTVIGAVGFSTISGISLGSHESFTFGYRHTGWLPEFMEDWYQWRPNTDAVFGKTFTWQKVFRSMDYATDRAAWNKWKQTWRVRTFWSWETLGAFGSHFIVKNTFATFVRDRMKHDNWWYSWKAEFLFGEQLFELLNEVF